MSVFGWLKKPKRMTDDELDSALADHPDLAEIKKKLDAINGAASERHQMARERGWKSASDDAAYDDLTGETDDIAALLVKAKASK